MTRIALSLLSLLIPCALGLTHRGLPDALQADKAHNPTMVWKRHGTFNTWFGKDKYVVLSVYSGRRDRMQLLLKHAKSLLKKGELDEIHFHTMQNRAAEDDKQWLSEQAEADDSITPYYPNNFADPYNFYADEWKPLEKWAGKTIVVKADDDVVYIDEDNFGKFTDYIKDHPDMFMVMANTINNGVSAYYQQQHGSIPKESNGVDMNMEYPFDGVPGSAGSLWGETPAKAEELHKIFLKDPKSFSWKADENDGCIVYRHPDHQDTQGRFSINFYGALHEKMGELANLVRSNCGADDECAVTTTNPNQNCMFTEFVVSHLSFEKQQNNGFNADEILKKYTEW